MRFIQKFKATNSEHRLEALYWLLTMGVGTLMPVLGGALVCGVWGKWPGVFFFASHGEFYIYSATLLSAAIYSLTKKSGVFVLSLLLIFACAFLYSSVISADIITTQEQINLDFVKISTIVTFVLAIGIAYLSRLSENIEKKPDLFKAEERRVKSLDEKFDQIGE